MNPEPFSEQIDRQKFLAAGGNFSNEVGYIHCF